jgi:hypothetical protein
MKKINSIVKKYVKNQVGEDLLDGLEDYHNKEKTDKRISKETMVEYEEVRQSGLTNMFDYYNVIRIADALKKDNLASISLEDYKYLLMNFSKLMKLYGIIQSGRKNT